MEHRAVAFDGAAIEAALSEFPLGGLRVFRRLGSTNDEALIWAAAGAADMSLVIADEQTAGRGRAGRAWLTPPGTALALSMILREEAGSEDPSGRLAGLGAMAVAEACDSLGLQASIKWPNDVLLKDRKVAGVLVEAQWSGGQLEASVIGVGVNVLRGSAPTDATVRYPATSIEESLDRGPSRIEVLRATVSAMTAWRPRVNTQDFVRAWERRLAFRGHEVRLIHDGRAAIAGRLDGLEQDGSLRLLARGEVIRVHMGELQLQPTDDRMG